MRSHPYRLTMACSLLRLARQGRLPGVAQVRCGRPAEADARKRTRGMLVLSAVGDQLVCSLGLSGWLTSAGVAECAEARCNMCA